MQISAPLFSSDAGADFTKSALIHQSHISGD